MGVCDFDHAWGWEPCTIAQVKAYKPQSNSISSGQVLQCPYDFDKGKLIVREMTELLVLDLVKKGLVTDQMVVTIGYDIENLANPAKRREYQGSITSDRYGRRVPKHAHGTANLTRQTSSTKLIMDAVMDLYDRIVDRKLLIRRINITANRVVPASTVQSSQSFQQLELFTDYEEISRQQAAEDKELERERKIQQATLEIQDRYGKNAILKGMNLQKGAMTIERNQQIGGHKA